jgi:hypothetical protein
LLLPIIKCVPAGVDLIPAPPVIEALLKRFSKCWQIKTDATGDES